MSEWIETDRPHGVCWVHSEKPVWVVHYGQTNRMGEHWQAYKAVAHIPKGRQPWTVDNRRLGGENGFSSFEAAKQAGESA